MQPENTCHQSQSCPHMQRTVRTKPSPCPAVKSQGVGSCLKQLRPRDFDTEDLLIVLLLLLMSGDCTEDQNTALLTLALYLFL